MCTLKCLVSEPRIAATNKSVTFPEVQQIHSTYSSSTEIKFSDKLTSYLNNLKNLYLFLCGIHSKGTDQACNSRKRERDSVNCMNETTIP